MGKMILGSNAVRIKIRELRAKGMSMNQIEKETGFDYATVRGEFFKKRVGKVYRASRESYPLNCFNPSSLKCWISGFGD